jgi:hypothetical protein
VLDRFGPVESLVRVRSPSDTLRKTLVISFPQKWGHNRVKSQCIHVIFGKRSLASSFLTAKWERERFNQGVARKSCISEFVYFHFFTRQDPAPRSHFECRNDLLLADTWCCPIYDFLVQNARKVRDEFCDCFRGVKLKKSVTPKKSPL